jgi:hypothetical protein
MAVFAGYRMPRRWSVLGQAIEGDTIRELHDRIIALAQERGLVHGRKIGVDTTVVETNLHHRPTMLDNTNLQHDLASRKSSMSRISKRKGHGRFGYSRSMRPEKKGLQRQQ